jgi:hypothetical protein
MAVVVHVFFRKLCPAREPSFSHRFAMGKNYNASFGVMAEKRGDDAKNLVGFPHPNLVAKDDSGDRISAI